MRLRNGFATGQFAAAVAALTVVDLLRLVAATVIAKDHALRFLPIKNYIIFFQEYSACNCTIY